MSAAARTSVFSERTHSALGRDASVGRVMKGRHPLKDPAHFPTSKRKRFAWALRGVPLLLLFLASQAEARPITLTWDFTIVGSSAGPFDGTHVLGELAYAYDPILNPPVITYNPDGTIASIQYPRVPVSYFVLNFGGLFFGLNDAVSAPFFNPVVSSGTYGLSFVLRPHALPANSTFSIVPAGSLLYSLSGPFGVHIGQESFSVPETASLFLGSGASLIGVLAFWLLRR